MQGNNIFNKEIKIKSSIIILLIVALVGSMSAVGFLLNDNPDIIISKGDSTHEEEDIRYNSSIIEGNQEEIETVEEIKVYVTGEVNNPGVVTLKKGQIVKDAIDLAGGMSENADIDNINLAFELKENVMLRIKPKATTTLENTSGSVLIDNYVLTKPPSAEGSTKTNSVNSSKNISNNNQGNIITSRNDSSIPENNKNETYDKTLLSMDIIKDSGGVVVEEDEAEEKKGAKININIASAQELDTLPGIGPSTADKIISYRDENGEYKKIEDIMDVSGIGENKFNSLKEYIVTD